MSEKCNKTCKSLHYVENLLVLPSTVTAWASIASFASLVCVPVGITSSAVGINICAITAWTNPNLGGLLRSSFWCVGLGGGGG